MDLSSTNLVKSFLRLFIFSTPTSSYSNQFHKFITSWARWYFLVSRLTKSWNNAMLLLSILFVSSMTLKKKLLYILTAHVYILIDFLYASWAGNSYLDHFSMLLVSSPISLYVFWGDCQSITGVGILLIYSKIRWYALLDFKIHFLMI